MIITGTKEVRKRLGYVAEFCPLCRDVRAFEVTRIGMSKHLYFVAYQKGELVGFIRRCMTCRTDLSAVPDTYRQLSDKPLPVQALLPLTHPDLKERYAARLAVEADLANRFKKVPQATRAELIKEPFLLLSPKVEKRFGSFKVDELTLGTALITWIVLPYIFIWLQDVLPRAAEKVLSVFAAAAFTAGLVAVGVLHYRSADRFLRKEIYPVLVPALLPLKPTPQELDTVLKQMAMLGRKIGSKIKLQPLLDELGG